MNDTDSSEMESEIESEMESEMDETFEEIERLIKEISSYKRNNDHKFNTEFLLGITIFTYYYRFFVMHIDKNNELTNYISECLDL